MGSVPIRRVDFVSQQDLASVMPPARSCEAECRYRVLHVRLTHANYSRVKNNSKKHEYRLVKPSWNKKLGRDFGARIRAFDVVRVWKGYNSGLEFLVFPFRGCHVMKIPDIPDAADRKFMESQGGLDSSVFCIPLSADASEAASIRARRDIGAQVTKVKKICTAACSSSLHPAEIRVGFEGTPTSVESDEYCCDVDAGFLLHGRSLATTLDGCKLQKAWDSTNGVNGRSDLLALLVRAFIASDLPDQCLTDSILLLDRFCFVTYSRCLTKPTKLATYSVPAFAACMIATKSSDSRASTRLVCRDVVTNICKHVFPSLLSKPEQLWREVRAAEIFILRTLKYQVATPGFAQLRELFCSGVVEALFDQVDADELIVVVHYNSIFLVQLAITESPMMAYGDYKPPALLALSAVLLALCSCDNVPQAGLEYISMVKQKLVPDADLFESAHYLLELWVEPLSSSEVVRAWRPRGSGLPTAPDAARLEKRWPLLGLPSLAFDLHQVLTDIVPAETACLSSADEDFAVISAHRRRMKTKTPPSQLWTVRTCSLCVEDQSRCCKLACKHGWFCSSCLERHAATSLEAGAVSMSCPECSTAITEHDARRLLSTSVVDRFISRGLDVAMTSFKDSFACPTPDCPFWVVADDAETGFLDCPACEKTCCFRCGSQPYHVGAPCKESGRAIVVHGAEVCCPGCGIHVVKANISECDSIVSFTYCAVMFELRFSSNAFCFSSTIN